MNNTSVESYLLEGCGRCDKFQTPQCKVHLWTDSLLALRELLRTTELVEEMKWGSPCYTLDGKNVLMMTSFKAHCSLSFFKGAALDDPLGLLESPGPNSRYMRLLKFTSYDEFQERRADAAAFIQKAIDAERAGVTIDPGEREPVPEELEQRLEADPELKNAFEALSPGRQRSHILHVSGAKARTTRERRVEKCASKILAGKGFNER